MTAPPVPRYFVPRAGADRPSEARAAARPLVHAVDGFYLGARHLRAREWIAAQDLAGAPRLLPADERAALPADVQSQLAFHEVARGAAPRLIDAAELYLFALELMEQPAATGEAATGSSSSGLGDPVHLYGTLSGPYPRAASDGPAPEQQGRLTVTRRDVLEGFVQGAPHAFAYAPPAAGASVPRCLHLLLAGDRDEAIAAGRGLVLAYALPPGELGLGDAANEFLVNQLVHDLLAALQEAARATKAPGGAAGVLRDRVLPVPSRTALAQRLASEGYVLEGDTAVRRPGASATGIKGVLASVVGAFASDRVALPPEGTTGDYHAIARAVLAAEPPPARVVALRQRVTPVAPPEIAGEAHAPLAPPLPPAPPRATPARAPGPPRVAAAAPPAGPPAWMLDFVAATSAARRDPNAPPPRLTHPAAAARAVAAAGTTPDWMRDFDEPPPPPPPPPPRPGDAGAEPATSAASDKPDWMKDFE